MHLATLGRKLTQRHKSVKSMFGVTGAGSDCNPIAGIKNLDTYILSRIGLCG